VRRIVAEMFSTRMANTLRLRVAFRSSREILGDSLGKAKWQRNHDHSRKEYSITIDKELSAGRMIEVIAHELAHVRQYAEGRLRHGGEAGHRGWWWKPTREGKAEFFPYDSMKVWAERPWEKEAVASEAVGRRIVNLMRGLS